MWTAALGADPSCWSAATNAMDLWVEGSGDARSPRRDHDVDRYEAWAKCYSECRRWLAEERKVAGARAAPTLDSEHVTGLASRCSDGQDLDRLHAVAWAIDYATHHTFPAGWRADTATEVVTLGEGDWFPVSDANWPAARQQGQRPITRPASLTDAPDGQLPHAKRFAPRAVADRAVIVEIDFTADATLSAVFEDLHTLAGIHANQTDREFVFGTGGPTNFPIVPALADQADRLERKVRTALRRDCGVIVIPELAGTSVTEETPDTAAAPASAEILRTLVDELGEHTLLVAGSVHRENPRRNVTTILLPDHDPLEHHKIVGFSSELSERDVLREGLDTSEPAVLRLWQASNWRLAVVICKDLLDRDLADLLGHLGANVVLAPAMSPKTETYEDRLRSLKTDAQAVGLMVNAPAVWSGELTAQPDALLVVPFIDAEPIRRNMAGTRGVSLLRLRDKVVDI